MSNPFSPSRQRRRTPAVGLGAAALVLLAAAGPAAASDRWEEAGSGAVAILPMPAKAVGITSASLACAQQRWTLRLRTEPRDGAAGETQVSVTVDRGSRSVKAARTLLSIDVPVAPDLLQAMEGGTRLVVAVGEGEGAPAATFALRGSQKVIDAVAPRCSPVDMAGYDHVSLAADDPGAAEAERLLKDEVARFRLATSTAPTLTARSLDRESGRRLLFATLCGSSWYYGRSGCSLFGFAREASDADWRLVYNSEGMALYLDPKVSRSGWPDLATLAPGRASGPVHWVWDGSAYGVHDLEATDGEVAGDQPSSFHYAQ